ncbi:amino acid kinase family protein [Candidatus Vidania fulgoroideorum]
MLRVNKSFYYKENEENDCAMIVIKFGGSSLSCVDRIASVARKIEKINDIYGATIVIVSAPYGYTNMISGIKERECATNMAHNVLLSVGENISGALMAGVLKKSICLNALQVPIIIEEARGFGFGRIIYVCKKTIRRYMKMYRNIIISGYQGININNVVYTLERGGSDTSAIVISHVMGGGVCYIFTDVDGVCLSDPRLYKTKVVKYINPVIMMELSGAGARVLAPQSVRYAFCNRVSIRVISSYYPYRYKELEMCGTLINMKKTTTKTYLVKQEEYLIETRSLRLLKECVRDGKDVDMISIRNDRIFFTTKISSDTQSRRIVRKDRRLKISFIGIRIKECSVRLMKIIELAELYACHGIINTSEVKVSFLIEEKNLVYIVSGFKNIIKAR